MRQALRALAARPGFTSVAVATLAIGFAVNAAIFSLTRTVLLRPLPFKDADRLVLIGEANRARGISYFPAVPANYLAWRERVTSLEATAPWRFVYFTLSGLTDRPTRVQGVIASASFFPLLGVTPALGRPFTADDERPGNDRVILLSPGFWRREFGGDPRIVGRSLIVDGTPCTIVGVLPDRFKFFRVLNRELDVWRPFVFDRADREHSINLYAKLKAGVTLESARAELATAFAALPPETFREGWTTDVATLSTRFSVNQRPILQALQFAVALVLCIAAANIANLVLASAAARRKDVAIRVALGATRWRLMLELGRETLLLATAGAAAGVLLAIWIVDLLNSSVSYQDINRIEPFRVDGLVVAFTLGLGVVNALVFALLPVWRAPGKSDADVVDALKESSGATAGVGHRHLRGALVVGELALSIVLLTSALELTRHALSLNAIDRGVDADRVMSAQLSLGAPQYADTRRLTQFADAVLARLSDAVGIERASLVNYLPLSVIGTGTAIAIEGQPAAAGQEPVAQFWIVAPHYFATVGVRLLAGRDFDRSDAGNTLGVAIVSRRFAQRFWNRLDVTGERLTPLFPSSDAYWIPRTTRAPVTVVGVVEDVREDGIPGFIDDRAPQLYLPYSQNPTRIVTLVARTSAAPHALAPLIREAVRAVDRDQPTFDEKTIDEVRQETFARSREIAWLIGAFAMLALILSAIGVYGVMAYLTTARSREIGIRIALGASRRDVLRMVLGDAMRLAAAGGVIGIVAAPVAIGFARGWIAGLDRSHPAVLIGAPVLLALVCAGAAAIPARRAANAAAISFR